MEAATTGGRTLAGDKAVRHRDAMRAPRSPSGGTAGSTFDQVARARAFSRGLLHYYFGTRSASSSRSCGATADMRMAALDEHLAQARDRRHFIAVLLGELEDVVRNDPGYVTLLFELFVLSAAPPGGRGGVLRAAAPAARTGRGVLRAKEAEGVLHLSGRAGSVVDVLFSLGTASGADARRGRDFGPTDRPHHLAFARFTNPIF